MKASMILPTFNKIERLKLVLYSIEQQSADIESFEVIIVDDGSSDGTELYLRYHQFKFDCIYVRQYNAGRAAARNTGIEKARNEIIIFIDDDTVLCNEFVEEHLKCHEVKNVVVHGRIREIPYLKFFSDPTNAVLYESIQIDVCQLKEISKICISQEDIRHCFKEKVHNRSKLTSLEKIIKYILDVKAWNWYWLCFCGGNISVPKEWIDNLGGFDEAFGTLWGCEDLDLGYRLMKSGYEFQYSENAVNYHIDHYRNNYILEHERTSDDFYNKFKDDNILIFQKYVENKITRNELISVINETADSFKESLCLNN